MKEERRRISVSDLAVQIRNYAREKNDWFTRKDVVEALKLERNDKMNKAIARAFSAMVEKGWLKREGDKATTRYRVNYFGQVD